MKKYNTFKIYKTYISFVTFLSSLIDNVRFKNLLYLYQKVSFSPSVIIIIISIIC